MEYEGDAPTGGLPGMPDLPGLDDLPPGGADQITDLIDTLKGQIPIPQE